MRYTLAISTHRPRLILSNPTWSALGGGGDEGGAVRLPTLRVSDARGPSRVSLTEVLNDVQTPARECEESRSNGTWASSVAGEKPSSNTVTCMRPSHQLFSACNSCGLDAETLTAERELVRPDSILSGL